MKIIIIIEIIGHVPVDTTQIVAWQSRLNGFLMPDGQGLR